MHYVCIHTFVYVCLYVFVFYSILLFFNLIYPPTPQSALINVCARVFGLLLVICVQVLFLNNFLSFSFSFCFWREFVWFLIIQVYVGYNQPQIINMFSFVNNTDINCALNVIYWAPLAAHVAYASLPPLLSGPCKFKVRVLSYVVRGVLEMSSRAERNL